MLDGKREPLRESFLRFWRYYDLDGAFVSSSGYAAKGRGIPRPGSLRGGGNVRKKES